MHCLIDFICTLVCHLNKQYNLIFLVISNLIPPLLFRQLRPLSELVKEVQCAGVKKHYLRRAIEQYMSESDPCHCKPCRNNGMAFMDGDECKCVCKPGTSGLACEHGTEAEGQQGACYISDNLFCEGGLIFLKE